VAGRFADILLLDPPESFVTGVVHRIEGDDTAASAAVAGGARRALSGPLSGERRLYPGARLAGYRMSR
jgi:hypothetical protein